MRPERAFKRALLLSLPITLSSSLCYSEITDHQAQPFILDQSQDVYFEEYSVSSFTQSLLNDKDKFGYTQVILGGMAEADLQHWRGDSIVTQNPGEIYNHDTAFYLTQVTLDVMANLTLYTTLFTTASLSAIGQGGESGNYANLPYAFILIGNLEQYPLYFYGGYNAITFGQFQSSGGWDYPLTSDYFQPQVSPSISLGYQNKDWNVSTTVFTDQVLYENHMVYNIAYQHTLNKINYNMGAGYLTHLDLSTTGDVNINRSFFRDEPNMNTGNVADAYLTLGYDALSLSGEYVRGSKAVLMNTEKPSAYGFALRYSPSINDINYIAGISFSRSIHLKDVSTILSGQDQIPFASDGLKNIWAASLTRNFFGSWFYLGLNAERDLTYADQKTYTLTLDATAYL